MGVPGDTEAVTVERFFAVFRMVALVNDRVAGLGDELVEGDFGAQVQDEATHGVLQR